MSILVTGGAGYIGSHIVKQLSEMGEEVVVFDNLSAGRREALLHNEALIIGDITSTSDLEEAFGSHRFETVIHLAALVDAAASVKEKDQYQRVNDQGSRNVWELGKKYGVKHFLYASSAAVYGTPDGQYAVSELDPLHPSSPYGETKLLGEKSLTEIAPPANYLAFRFFNVAGAEEGGRLFQSKDSASIMQRAYATACGKLDKLTINGNDYDTKDGTVVRDFVHVEDIAFAFVLGLHYLRKGGESRILNLGSGVDHTISEVIKEVELASGSKLNIEYGPRVKGDISYSLADPRLAEKVLGWEPAHTLRLIVRDGYNAYVQNQ